MASGNKNNYLIFASCLTILFLLIFLYAPTFKWMYGRFTATDTYYSHGFLIPFVTGFLIWQKRDALRKTQEEYSWIGVILILLGLCAHLASMVLYVFFSSGFSLFLVILGLSLFLFGKKVTGTIFFPLMFLLFMFPLPMGVINKIAYPMKMNVASGGSNMVNLMGFSVYQTGFFIETTGGVLLIDNPCSGLRSLIAFLAMGSLLAYLTKTSTINKLLIAAASVIVALVTNIVRVVFLLLVASFYGVEKASPGSFPHDASGYAIFLVGGSILFLLARIFEWNE